uniref:Uncharacterized protein n=1 Tax=Daphnia galeata TaxID=27404 RepID=A0A8J2RPJ0_9CRUS|nr:unnamed protein product [Daphnia galeata]
MQLSRINLGKFRDWQSFQDRNVRVRYTNAELSAPIKFIEHAELTVTDEWNNLKEQLKEAGMKLEKMNNELSQVKRDFTNKLEGTKQELEKTKTELQKTRDGLSKTVDNLSKKLNATEKELAETKIRTANLATEFKMNIQRVGHEIKVAEGNVKKDLRGKNFKQFGNCNKKFDIDDDGIEQDEIGRCGFNQNVE